MSQSFIVIIAGGRGERFWPQSRLSRPKHLLPIVGSTPMLAQTLARVKPIAPPRNLFVITSARQEKAVREVCARFRLPAANIVAEPVGRDTAAAVGLAAALVAQRDPKGVFAILPADHVIEDTRAYQRDLRAALRAAAAGDVIVTIGIKPDQPATGFGYIRKAAPAGNDAGGGIIPVAEFVEKPDLATAQRYLASGEYLWNAGMFVWSVPTVEAGLKLHAPELHAGLAPVRAALAKGRRLGPVLAKVYPKLQKISVDYALLEKSRNVVVLPASFDWDDVGEWPAVARHHGQDEHGNVSRGPALVEQGRNNIVISEGRHLVAVVGADDLIVVHTPDATLVCPKNRAQDIKALLKRVEAQPGGQRWL
ncbi:MAG TPA: sugar phosphate nucleotidyltransferase [Opitutaceae bacterium]|nr:sugar phosphate nucleotidyltransferase [Opitutaceae bacterium]